MAPSRFQQVMEYWIADETHPGIENYSFVDLGCGKGRAVLMASSFRFRRGGGSRVAPGLAGIAESNLAAWTAAGERFVRCGSSARMRPSSCFPSGHCLLYLFNPFAAPVMKQLIERIEAEFADRPGMLDLIYFNPESAELLDAHGGFELPVDRDGRDVRGGCGGRSGGFAGRYLQRVPLGWSRGYRP